MAGLIQALFGGKQSPAMDIEPAPGVGGYTLGAGRAGQTGFPGSTKQTRVNLGKSPRAAKIRADSDTGFEQELSSSTQERQAAYRGDQPTDPRRTPYVGTPQPVLTRVMQDQPGTQYGGQVMKTGPGNEVVGGNPLRRSQQVGGHSQQDTTTPYSAANVTISGNVPGSNNVRNTIALKYKNAPGELHTYKSAARPDQAPVNPGGQQTDGNVHPDRVVQEVTVQNRSQFPDNGGVLSWDVMREMPYGRRGDGARGADLNGQRRYATGQEDQFWNAGQGEYGQSRKRGRLARSSVSFTQPAPWSSNVYTTTPGVGTNDAPNTQPAQQPAAVYVSPSSRRANNRTGRRT